MFLGPEVDLNRLIADEISSTCDTVVLTQPWHLLLHWLVKELLTNGRHEVLIHDLVEVALVVACALCTVEGLVLGDIALASDSSHI